MPPAPTGGLLWSESGRPSVSRSGTVSRPCHNTSACYQPRRVASVVGSLVKGLAGGVKNSLDPVPHRRTNLQHAHHPSGGSPMRRRAILLFAVAFCVVILAALAAPKKSTL